MKSNLSKTALELARRISHEVWDKYDDMHGYRTEKQSRNNEVSSDHPDNIWFFWSQFDSNNQNEFMFRLRGAIDENTDGAQELHDFLLKELGKI